MILTLGMNGVVWSWSPCLTFRRRHEDKNWNLKPSHLVLRVRDWNRDTKTLGKDLPNNWGNCRLRAPEILTFRRPPKISMYENSFRLLAFTYASDCHYHWEYFRVSPQRATWSYNRLIQGPFLERFMWRTLSNPVENSCLENVRTRWNIPHYHFC